MHIIVFWILVATTLPCWAETRVGAIFQEKMIKKLEIDLRDLKRDVGNYDFELTTTERLGYLSTYFAKRHELFRLIREGGRLDPQDFNSERVQRLRVPPRFYNEVRQILNTSRPKKRKALTKQWKAGIRRWARAKVFNSLGASPGIKIVSDFLAHGDTAVQQETLRFLYRWAQSQDFDLRLVVFQDTNKKISHAERVAPKLELLERLLPHLESHEKEVSFLISYILKKSNTHLVPLFVPQLIEMLETVANPLPLLVTLSHTPLSLLDESLLLKLQHWLDAKLPASCAENEVQTLLNLQLTLAMTPSLGMQQNSLEQIRLDDCKQSQVSEWLHGSVDQNRFEIWRSLTAHSLWKKFPRDTLRQFKRKISGWAINGLSQWGEEAEQIVERASQAIDVILKENTQHCPVLIIGE